MGHLLILATLVTIQEATQSALGLRIHCQVKSDSLALNSTITLVTHPCFTQVDHIH